MIMLPQHSQQLCAKTVFHKPHRAWIHNCELSKNYSCVQLCV